MMAKDGKFADCLKWLTASGDPAIISHPVIVLVSDTLWSGVVYQRFINYKMWDVLSLIVFMLTQGILPGMAADAEDRGDKNNAFNMNLVIFIGRMFTYVLGMGRLT